MTGHRYTVVGLARPRVSWTERITGWAAEATLPIEFTKTLSVAELASRLDNGLRPSAVIIDAAIPGVDRDILAIARDAGSMVIIVEDGAHHREWVSLGADIVIDADFDDQRLLSTLSAGAERSPTPQLSSVDALTDVPPPGAHNGWAGQLVTICGGAGMGTSTIAQMLSQGASLRPEYAGRVCLVDLATNGHQALFHHSGDVLPGLQELVEAHRSGEVDPADLAAFVWTFDHLAYDLVLGLRRTRDWTVISPSALAASMSGLRRRYRLLVADIDAEFDGEQETGSIDIEERNGRARSAIHAAELIAVCTTADLKGLHESIALTDRLTQAGVLPDRIQRIINHAPKSPRTRARITSDLASLGAEEARRPPIFVESRSSIETCRRAAGPLPDHAVRRLADSVLSLMSRSSAPLTTEADDDRGRSASTTGRST